MGTVTVIIAMCYSHYCYVTVIVAVALGLGVAAIVAMHGCCVMAPMCYSYVIAMSVTLCYSCCR